MPLADAGVFFFVFGCNVGSQTIAGRVLPRPSCFLLGCLEVRPPAKPSFFRSRRDECIVRKNGHALLRRKLSRSLGAQKIRWNASKGQRLAGVLVDHTC